MFAALTAALALLVGAVLPHAGLAQLRGHGGPVRAIAVLPDGETAISGSFDHSAILWDIDQGLARTVLRVHDGAVNAVAVLGADRVATGGEDGRIAVFAVGSREPIAVIPAHQGPIVSLAVAPGSDRIAAASWDGAASIRSLSGGPARVLTGHKGNVNAVAFLPNGWVATAGYDATVRLWPSDDGAALTLALTAPLNALAVLPDNRLAAAGADGMIHVIAGDGTLRGTIEATGAPIAALAAAPDGRLAASSIAGEIVILDPSSAAPVWIPGSGSPVWALAFRAGGRELLSGGNDALIRRWNAATGEPIGLALPGEAASGIARDPADRGAALFRACAACHSLTAAGGNRAGPSLHGVFGRPIATAAGYNYSEALKQLDIVWNADTIGKLFEIGPSRYTPGTKMPEQLISNPDDRAALVRFLERATAEP